MKTGQQSGGFTGRHMLFTMIAFFAVIITANLTMAMFARSSWTGLVVENSYVASQQFNAKMALTRKQAALGWESALSVEEGYPRYVLRDENGRVVRLSAVTLTFKRPIDDREDKAFVLEANADGAYSSAQRVADGAWLVEVVADASLDYPYRETFRIKVEEGSRI